MRTSPSVLRVLARELLAAKTLDDLHAAAGPVKRRLLGTGAYSGVTLSGEAATPDGDAVNVVVGLQPRRAFGLSTGGTHSASGKVEAGLEVSLVDTLGAAETVKLAVATSAGSMTISDIVQSVSATAEPMLTGGAGGAAAAAPSAEALRASFAPTPSIKLQLSAPTCGAWEGGSSGGGGGLGVRPGGARCVGGRVRGHRPRCLHCMASRLCPPPHPRPIAGSYPAPVTLQLRKEKESHALTSGFVADVSAPACCPPPTRPCIRGARPGTPRR